MKPQTRYNSEINILNSLFPDSDITLLPDEDENYFVMIKWGRLKRVICFLYDCGVNFTIYNNKINFEVDELRMIE
jgi:hypothetical protein